jgi:CRP/FNR family transcriptional regulator/CRP/FNR family cyclic AMP-dependent transcriptional regulator
MAGLEKAMAATPIMQSIPAKGIRDMVAQGTVRQYRRGTYLFYQGDPSDHVLFHWQGKIEMSSISVTGHRQLITTLDQPQFFGELGVLGEQDRTATALALEPSVVWVIGGERFLGFLGAHESATRALLRSLARQIQAHESFVEDLLFLDLKGRVAKRLLQLVSPSLDEMPPDGSVVPAVTHADLASLCGGSRENVTRILSELQRRGLVLRDGRRYVIKSVAGLRSMAGL